MRPTRLLIAALATLTIAGTVLVVAPSASASTTKSHQLGTRSLAAVLTSDGNTFDHNPYDYDIVTQAVLAVLAAKPNSSVGVLADGNRPVTAFLPTDQAFRILVKDLTGKWMVSEKKVFAVVAGLGIDTVETVLLYHVIPGVTITKKAALGSNGAVLTTAQGGTVKVRVRCRWHPVVSLVDQDPDARNPRVVTFNLHKGNKQIAHGVDRVLRPVNL